MSETMIEQGEESIEGAQDGEQPDDETITEEQAAETADDETASAQEAWENAGAPAAIALTEAEIEKRYKALEREQARHATAIEKVFGEEAAELVTCPFCEPELQGFLRMVSLEHPRDEMHAAMIAVLSKPQQVTYKHSPKHQTCPDCEGEGKFETGSHVPEWKLLTCDRCNGHGFEPPPGTRVGSAQVALPAPVTTSGLPFEPLEEERDEFGSPRYLDDGRENPNYGKTMRYKDPAIESEYLARLSGGA